MIFVFFYHWEDSRYTSYFYILTLTLSLYLIQLISVNRSKVVYDIIVLITIVYSFAVWPGDLHKPKITEYTKKFS